MKTPRRLDSLVLLALFALTAAIYWPGLAGDFMFDDYVNIVENPSVKAFDGTFVSLLDASREGVASPLGRPLSAASFALNYYFGGPTPFYFKLTNLLIHLACGLLVYVFARQIWPALTNTPDARYAAAWIAAAWLLHPINLTPVLFVVQRMTGLATLFTLAALCLYLHGRSSSGAASKGLLAASLLVAWPAGILAKETALLFPLFALLLEWLVTRSLDRIPRRRAWMSGVAILLLGASLLFLAWPLIEGSYNLRRFTLQERVLTEPRVLWLYIVQLIAPWPDFFSLHHDDIAVSTDFFTPSTTTPALLGWLAATGFAISQHRTRPWLTFSALWFLTGHALESTVIGLEIAYEHRNHLPSLGIIFGAAAFAVRYAPPQRRVLCLAAALAFLCYCALATGIRAAQWSNEYRRTQVEVSTHPDSARSHQDAARAILAETLPTGAISPIAYQMARRHFERAAQINPWNKEALAAILYLDCAVGTAKDVTTTNLLLDRLETTPLQFNEQAFIQKLSDLLVHNLMCLDERDIDALLSAALANPTATGKIRGMLHAVAMDYAAAAQSSLPKALLHARAAVDSDPGNAVLRINLIRVLLQQGNVDEAKQHYAKLESILVPAGNKTEVRRLGEILKN